jgi:hypothetical protein
MRDPVNSYLNRNPRERVGRKAKDSLQEGEGD